MDDQFKELAVILREVSENLKRLAVAVEAQNEFGAKLMRCPRCLGDGKAYNSDRRCIKCGGTGTKSEG